MADISSHFQEAIEFIGELIGMHVVSICLSRQSSFNIFWFTGFASKGLYQNDVFLYYKAADSVGLALRIGRSLKTAREENKYPSGFFSWNNTNLSLSIFIVRHHLKESQVHLS